MAMKVFSANTVLGAADTNEYLVNTKLAIKPTGETVNSAPNLHDDADLLLHVDTSKTYEVTLYVAYTSNASAGFQFAFGAPAGAVLYGNYITCAGFSTIACGSYDANGTLLNATVGAVAQGAPSHDFVMVNGLLVTAGTAGNFKFRWSQTVSNVNNCTVWAGASMIMRRVS